MPVRCMVNFFGYCCCRWLAMSLGNFLFGFQEDGKISCPMVSVSFMEHAVERLVLKSAPTVASVRIAASGLVAIFSMIICPIIAFWLWRSEIFISILQWSTSIRVDVVNLSMRCVKT
jgi:hypothetical protein